MGRRPNYDNDGSGIITPDEIAEFNRRYDAEQRKLPPHLIPVPQGFDKRLDDEQLDPLVWASIREREQQQCNPLDLCLTTTKSS